MSVRNEFIKVWTFKKIVILIMFIFIANMIAYGLCENTSNDNWQEEASKIKQEYVDILSQEESNEVVANEIRIIEYCIENNIPYEEYGFFSYLDKVTLFNNFLLIIIVMFSVGTYTIEKMSGSIKNILCTGISMRTVINYKYIYLLLQAIVIIISFYSISSIIGISFFADSFNYKSIVLSEGNIKEISLVAKVIVSILLLCIKSVFMITITEIIYIIFNGSKWGEYLSIFLILFSSLISQIIPWEQVDNLLPFKYLSYVYEGDYKSFAQTFCVLAVYMFVIKLLSNYRMKYIKI